MEREMEHSLNKVFVAADNIISSLGFTTKENVEAMLRGETGIRVMNNPAIYPESFQAGSIDKKRLQQACEALSITHYPAFEQLAVLSVTDALKQTSIDITNEKSLLILSTTKGNIEFLKSLDKATLEKKSAIDLQPAFLWKSAQNIAAHFKMKNTPLVVSNACVSGVSAVELAAQLLRDGLYENVVVCGADLITAFTVSGFQSFKSISPEPCKPYDANRDGLSIGEGAGTIILTHQEKNISGDKNIYVLGGATANDANHISGPSRTGDGLHYAMENAIARAGICKSELDFMNLHGTATVFNDEMESKAVALSSLSEVPANSFKGFFGHTLGASGIIEIIACIESLKRQQLIATRGFSTLGVPEKMNIIAKNTSKEIHAFLKTASGFGGFNSAIVIADYFPNDVPHATKTEVHITAECSIHNHQIVINGQPVYENPEAENIEAFLKAAFKNLEVPNMKFYKMDNLCKLGYLAQQYLLRQSNAFENYDKKKVALLFTNSVSSLDTDVNHQLTICDAQNYFPSPAIFVYTLPNIVLGEMCIKEKLQGETSFILMEKYNKNFFVQYAERLFRTTDTEAAMVGRLECLGESYEAEIFIVEKKA